MGMTWLDHTSHEMTRADERQLGSSVLVSRPESSCIGIKGIARGNAVHDASLQ